MTRRSATKDTKINKARSLGIDMDFENTTLKTINKMIKLAEA